MGQACTKHITYMISYHLPKNPVRGQESHPPLHRGGDQVREGNIVDLGS